jgi:TonB family protein
MKQYDIVDDFVILEEVGTDSLGRNYRAVKLENHKPTGHRLLTEVHPFLLKEPSAWAKIQILLEAIARVGRPKLYSPERIIEKDDKSLLLFPYIEGKTLDQIMEDSARKKVPVKFDLTFSIVIALANLIDLGVSIDFGREALFHGFLTPDHIIIGYNGKVFVKYFGVWPFIDKSENIISHTIKKYGAWLTPEFIKGEEVVQQADIYHLGYIVYRMLTGQYFSYLPGEGFERTITSISFSYNIPSTDKEFLTNLINFFRKTLNPDIRKRFKTTKEFRIYIKEYFGIEDTSSFASDLASLMYALYQETMQQERRQLCEELCMSIPEKVESGVTEKISTPIEFTEKKGSKNKYFIFVLVVIVAAAVGFGVFQYVDYLNQKKQEYTAVSEMETKIARLEQYYQKKIEELKSTYEKKITEDDSKKEAQAKERDQLIQKIEQQKQEEIEGIKQDIRARGIKLDEWGKPSPDRARVQPPQPREIAGTDEPQESESGGKESPGTLPKEQKAVELSLAEVSQPPLEIAAEEPKFPLTISKNYAGKQGTAQISVLIDENGNVEGVKVLNDIPQDIRAIVVDTVQKWKYRPARQNNVRVKVWLPAEIKFSFKKVESEDEIGKGEEREPEQTVQAVEMVSLNELTARPVKIAGEPPKFPIAIRETYAGRRSTVRATILIDENGSVEDVNILSRVPDDISAVLVHTLKQWKYRPGRKGDIGVKVWLPISLKISFR